MNGPLAGYAVILQALPRYCLLCLGRRVVQLRASAEPPVPWGGPYRCPACTPDGLPRGEALPIPVLPMRRDVPREAAA